MAETLMLDPGVASDDLVVFQTLSGSTKPLQAAAASIETEAVSPRLRELTSIGVDATKDAWMALLQGALNAGAGRLAYYLLLKRLSDLIVASIALLLLCPLLLVVALVIRLDTRGPVIFRQERIGRGGNRFVLYKFRTMAWDPDNEVHLFKVADGSWQHKIPDDPRVTRAGKFLRRASIDEWPQLINVIRGDMSVVGPRPELPNIVRTYEPWQHSRHLVRPGMTGWWQIQGRSEQPMHEHTDLDLYYVEHLSFRLDLQIVARTVRVVVSGFGAF